MPSDDLLHLFQEDLQVIDHWKINGQHYQRTLEAWLKKMDGQSDEIRKIFAEVFGQEEVTKRWVYWRIFFMACAELMGYGEGEEWMVAHYLLTPKPHAL